MPNRGPRSSGLPSPPCQLLLKTLVRVVYLGLLCVGLAACAFGQEAQKNKQETPNHIIANPTCGHVQISGSKRLPVNGIQAQQAEDCLWKAYQHCKNASLSVIWMGIDSGIIRSFILNQIGGKCAITDIVEVYVIPTRINKTTSYICSSLTRSQGGLLFLSCGADDSIFVPPAPLVSRPKTIFTLTPANADQTLAMKVGDTFLLALGNGFDWTITTADPGIVSRETTTVSGPGTQGIYKANHTGQTRLVARGDPPCRKSQPACGAPSQTFNIRVVVHS